VTTFWMFVDWLPVRNDDRFRRNCAAFRTSQVSEVRPIVGCSAHEEPFTVKLTITLEDFDRDCFRWNDLSFVSEHMRRAKALGPSDIQYFDVDASDCAPKPRAKNYRVMRVPVVEDVADLENSDYVVRHRADGSLEIDHPLNAVFRSDAEPAHELFHERSFKFIYCADAFAARVLRAGCSGAFFFDASRWATSANHRIRTRRGVEEIVRWNRRIFRTKLIEAIP
jgi:hypothetical protein